MLSSFPGLSRAKFVIAVVLLSLATPSTPAAEGIGWRTDGTGSYPTAQPPLEWSSTRNVLWQTAMPGYGVSHPVPLGQRIFICAEPCNLLCLHRDDGKILWQKTSGYAELEIAPDVRAQLKLELAETAQLAKKQSGVQREMDLHRRVLTSDKAPKEEIETKL